MASAGLLLRRRSSSERHPLSVRQVFRRHHAGVDGDVCSRCSHSGGNRSRCHLDELDEDAQVKKEAYLSGPMTGYIDFNFPMFYSAAAAWRALGNECISPAEQDQLILDDILGDGTTCADLPGYAEGDIVKYHSAIPNFTFDALLREDIIWCAKLPFIVMLPLWENSTGGRVERLAAEMSGSTVYLAIPRNDGRLSVDGWTFIEDEVQKRMTVSVLEKQAA